MFGRLKIVLGICALFGKTLALCSFTLDPGTSRRYVPIILKNGDILNPPDLTGYISLNDGEQIQLLCSGTRNFLKPNFDSLMTATCFNNYFFLNLDRRTKYSFDSFECKNLPQPEAKETSTCHTWFKLISIGFRLGPSNFLPKIELCFDQNTLTTYWSHHLLKTSDYSCRIQDSTSFKRDFFNRVNPTNAYNHTGFEKGHLTPRCDLFTGAEKRMTFYYINAAPQIKQFNNGNWKNLETSIRQAAFRRKKNLNIYTGTTGTKLYLINQTMPVPLYFWKVIIDSSSDNGVAFVGINDIENNATLNPCGPNSDVCEQLRWMQGAIVTDRTVTAKGRVYCCTINALRNIPGLLFPDLPQIPGNLLTDM